MLSTTLSHSRLRCPDDIEVFEQLDFGEFTDAALCEETLLKIDDSARREGRVRQAALDAKDIERVIDLLKGKWTVQILIAMRDHPVRLSELKRSIPAASKKALVANLRMLETERLVLRRDLSGAVLHVEYRLAYGLRDPLVAVLECLFEWSRLSSSLLEDADTVDDNHS